MENTEKKVSIALLSILILFSLLPNTYRMYTGGFSSCVMFHVFDTATDAFVCGNYYFGVYGTHGYNIEKAESYFERAIARNPNVPDVWHQYARIAFLRGDFEEALLRINKQFSERGDELMASYYIRGLIYGYNKQYAEAEADFNTFLKWDPSNWAANNDLAWIYFVQGKFKEAEAQAERGLKSNAANPWLLVMHAMARYNLGDSVGVEEELLRAEKYAANLTGAHWMRAYPGNDPRSAVQGLESFKAVIQKDLETVRNSTQER